MTNDTTNFQNAFNVEVEAWRLANYPEMFVIYENGPEPANEEEASPMFVDTSVRWYGASPSTVGFRARGRHSGALSLHVYNKVGEGSAAPGEVVDSLIELLRHRRLGGGVLAMPQRSVPADAGGWAKHGVLVPFHLDSA